MSDCSWPHGLYSELNSPGQNTGVGSHSLLQGIFPTQISNPGLLACRQILYQLSYRKPRLIKREERLIKRPNFAKWRLQKQVGGNPYHVLFEFSTLQEVVDHNLYGNITVSQRRHWHPTPVLLPGKSHGRRSLVGCSPWGR